MRALTIGELARATGVTHSALRYWEEQGLLPTPARVSGKRRYPASAVTLVAEILLLQDAGFTHREIAVVLASRAGGDTGWRGLHERKLVELDERLARIQAARTGIAHSLACKHADIRTCPTFRRLTAARLAGQPLHESHPH
jgi:DNA-binding transcriptional MerR regulator